MSPKLIRSALLSLVQAVSLAACSTAPATRYHLVPEPSPGAMIAGAATAPVPAHVLRTGLSVDRSAPAAPAARFVART